MGEPQTPAHAGDRSEVEFGRVVAFSDGVFTIAITLLVLTLEIPPGRDLADELAERGDQFLAYFISFAVLARFWLSHHRFYGRVERFDGRLIVLNLFYLAFIALLPFTTEVLGSYGDDSLGVAMYAANLAIISASFVVQIHYCYRQGLMRPDAADRAGDTGPENWTVTITFAASIPVAFLSPTAATLMWLSMFFVGRLLAQGGRRAKAG